MIDRTVLLLAALLTGLVVLETILARPHFVAGFHAVLAFGACVLVVLLSKALGRLFLQRPEDSDDS